MADYSDLSIVIPAFNEESGIAEVLGTLKTAMPDAEIIVVDDCSSDETADVALGFADDRVALIVMQHPFNQGYGAALTTGMRAATREYVAWFDADNEHRVDDLKSMIDLLRRDRLVAVIGQRPTSVNTVRAIGKGAIRLLARIFDIRAGHDLNCGLRIFRRDVIINYLPLLPARYSASLTTTILMTQRGYPTAFFPIETGVRLGQSKVKLADGFFAMAKVLNLITLFAPMRIFFRGGMLLSALGILYGTYISIADGLGFPVAGLLLIMAGFLLTVLGLLAEQIGQLRLGTMASERPAHRLYADDGRRGRQTGTDASPKAP